MQGFGGGCGVSGHYVVLEAAEQPSQSVAAAAAWTWPRLRGQWRRREPPGADPDGRVDQLGVHSWVETAGDELGDRELIHHLSEVCLLRDLYLHTKPAANGATQ